MSPSRIVTRSPGRNRGHDGAPALTRQALGDTDERSWIGDEQPRRPWHHGLDRPLRVLHPRWAKRWTAPPLPVAAIDARPAVIVHRPSRIDRFVAESVISLGHLFESRHRLAAQVATVTRRPTLT
jgi:hypothetical protein